LTGGAYASYATYMATPLFARLHTEDDADEDRISAFKMNELSQLRVSWTESKTSEWILE